MAKGSKPTDTSGDTPTELKVPNKVSEVNSHVCFAELSQYAQIKGQRLLRAQIRSAVLLTVSNQRTCLGRIINDPVIVEIY